MVYDTTVVYIDDVDDSLLCQPVVHRCPVDVFPVFPFVCLSVFDSPVFQQNCLVHSCPTSLRCWPGHGSYEEDIFVSVFNVFLL